MRGYADLVLVGAGTVRAEGSPPQRLALPRRMALAQALTHQDYVYLRYRRAAESRPDDGRALK